MTFQEVCKRYHLTPNLIDHLLEVAAITLLISENWKKELPFSKDEAVLCALLHDIGNMSKSKPETLHEYMPEASGDELKHWSKELALFQAKYGSDDHVATDTILKELSLSETIREAIQNKSFGNILKTVESNNWLLKIISYADLRINPKGIVDLQERLGYITERYPKYSERVDFEEMCLAAKRLEEEIQTNTLINLDKLTNKMLLDTIKNSKLKEKVI